MSTTVNYKGNTIASIENETKTLTTAGTWVEANIVITDETLGGSVIIKDETNSTGITANITGGDTILGSKTITRNGEYDPSDDNLDGYSSITVNIENRIPKENDEVCFWDYEGTLLYSCSMAEARVMTAMPDFPDHSNDEVPITPLCWNWTLAQLHSIQYPADIGAIYYPTDGKTHFFIELDEKTGLEFTVRQYNASTIDWGDGSTETTTASGVFSHTYTNYGRYHLTVTNVLQASTAQKTDIFTPAEAVVGTIYLSKDIDYHWLGTWNANLLSSTKIEYIVCPFTQHPTGDPFTSPIFLKHLNIDWIPISFGDSVLRNAYVLRHISLPYTDSDVVFKATYIFGNCYGLKRVRLQTGLSGARGTFYDCHSLEEISGDGYVAEGGTLSSFNNLYSLKSFKIRSDCTAVKGSKFLTNAYSLKDLYVYPETPPTLEYASINTHTFLRIHVPAASLTTYQEATNWSTYADYMIGDL